MRACTAPATLLLLGALAVGNSASAESSESGFWSSGATSLRRSGLTYRLATASGERAVSLPAGVEVEEIFALRRGVFLSARSPLSPANPERRDLFLALVDGQGLHELPSPGQSADSTRENAVPLTSSAGDLEGIAWLEGRDRQRYSIRHSTWDGTQWSKPVEVAAEGPGSQLALAGATLGDGSKLLVWSRFDGNDDEIVAALLVDGRWSFPQAIATDNLVPDVTPAAIAVPGGALAAWSRYDGHDYRVVISSFDGREWSSPSWAGPAGSTTPSLTPAIRGARETAEEMAAPATWLTFASALPRGWGVLELNRTGRVLRRGGVVDAPAARPAIAAQASGALRLVWATAARDLELE